MINVLYITYFKDKDLHRVMECKTGKYHNVTEKDLIILIKGNKIDLIGYTVSEENEMVEVEVYDTIESKTSNDKFRQLELFDAKQKLVGKVFDFEIDKVKDRILINRYYDVPGRTEITIPEFVDGFSESDFEDQDRTGGAFSFSKYIQKIIMYPNVTGAINRLFSYFKGTDLDLSCFDTRYVTSMRNLLSFTNLASVDLSGKFTTNNVRMMNSIFCYCNISYLDLTNFNTENVFSFDQSFNYFKAQKLVLGDKWFIGDTTTSCMFNASEIEELHINKKIKKETREDLVELIKNEQINYFIK